MISKKRSRIYIEEGRINLRKLRHDMAAAIDAAQNMIRMSESNPDRRSDYDVLIKAAVIRLKEICDSLQLNNLDVIQDFVQVKEGTT